MLAVAKTTRSEPKPRFKTPPGSELYFDHVIQRCRHLINVQIWAGMPSNRFEEWLGIFQSDEERYLAACVLDSLIYRSTNQVQGLMTQLLQRSLPEDSELLAHGGFAMDWQGLLHQHKDPKLRIVPVLRDDDPPSKSGPLITRLYKQLLQIDDNWMTWPWRMSERNLSGIRFFLMVDDFLGSGEQFIKFVKRSKMENLIEKRKIIYYPLIAHKTGIANIKRQYPHIFIIPAEVIDKSYDLFSSKSRLFLHGTNSLKAAKHFYEAFFKKRGAKISNQYLYGKGRLGLTLAFEFSIPNASLPLLWSNKGTLKPLFER